MGDTQRPPAMENREQDLYLELALERLVLLLRQAALEQRLLGADPQDPYRGLLLSDEEVDVLLQTLPQVGRPELSHPAIEALGLQVHQLDEALAGMEPPPASRLGQLLARLGLAALDRDILLLALLPEVDPRYGRLFAFLQDDVTRTRPSVFLALRLLCSDETGPLGRPRLLPDAPLRQHRLLQLEGYSHDLTPPLLQQAITVDERVARYLLDGESSDETPFPFLCRTKAGRPLADLLLPAELQEALHALLPIVQGGEVDIILLEGAAGSGRRTVARTMARELGRPLLELKVQGEGPAGLAPLERARLAVREACLQGGLLLCREGAGVELADWGQLTSEYGVALLLCGERFTGLDRMPAQTVRLVFPLPDIGLRQRLWEAYLAGRPVDGVRGDDLAARYRLNGGHIRDAVAWAEGLAYSRGRAEMTVGDLKEAIVFVVMPTLDELARPVPPRHRWEEMILPDDAKAHLREFTAAVRRRDQVYDTWGFERCRSLGRGLNALFTGPSGTGKTMAAEIIAGELGLPLFKIDLSAVVSKYVGETEKHLRRLFAEGERANAILFFDEADALFGKRSEVSDAHDRYANIEVAYLLQALEEHTGVTILATNLYGNMDDAFVRRMHFVIHFPFPDEPSRRRIWEVIFPAQAPRSKEMDLGDLARRFRVTGGHIRNIALGAAFLAAEDGQMITMSHLLQAARREFQKMGKVVDESNFISPGEGQPA